MHLHPTTFGVNRYCVSGDIMGLLCHVISQDHLSKGLRNFTNQSSPFYVTTKLGGREHFGSTNIILLVCLVISQNHVFKRSSDSISKSS